MVNNKNCNSPEFGLAGNSGPFFGFEFGDLQQPKLGGAPVFSAISEAERHRLVKGSKSPTRPSSPMDAKIFSRLALVKSPELPIQIDQTPVAKNSTHCGAYTVIGKRDWSGEYRIRTQVDSTVKQQPPENTGDRVTDMLTNRGARKIAESCEFMHLKRGGYTTFLTLTLDNEARERVSTSETTIQNEISRFFDGLKKVYKRGFDCEIDGKKHHVAGHTDKLDYLWVAECPDVIETETGEITGENPHVHVLMRYRVPYRYFEAWSKRVEKLWGQGFAHLEKIKDGEKAGSYMAKAAGYLCKAQGKNDQGTIRGNRYNISSSARAPDWVCVGRFQLGRMGFLLSEAAENFEDKFGHIKKKRDHLKRKLEKAKGPERHKIGALLEKTRTQLKKCPRLSKHQAVLKGLGQAMTFMHWAMTNEAVEGHDWLPEKAANEGFITEQGRGHWLAEYQVRRANRRMARRWSSWWDYQRQINEFMFSGDVLLPLVESEYGPCDEANDYLSEYNEWANNEGLMYG